MQNDEQSLEKRPGILFIGSSNVGKRTLFSRLVSVDFEDATDSPSEVLLRGWTINTKYYTADVSICIAQLDEEFSISNLSIYTQLAAIVMVFDMTEPSSLAVLMEWVSRNDLRNFEILLCIGNKADLVPGHPVHSEYRRKLLKVGESSNDSHLEFSDYGISETEGSSLLGDDESPGETRRSCLDWCVENNIEYIEACASNADFDKCLSVDGDSQGVERLLGALSAHMWPGMILKSGDKITEPSIPEKEVSADEESDYEVEYEILSAGSAEPWDDTNIGWVSANGFTRETETLDAQNNPIAECNQTNGTRCDKEELQSSTSTTSLHNEINKGVVPHVEEPNQEMNPDECSPFDFEDLEQLMSEIGNMRDNLRLMPDFQRREMAAKLALKMAAMFGGGSDDEEDVCCN
ncbi:uncharacterized protein LOC107424310 [Ziziphus jujuba]|uniref:Uncharacterized protein LOC107424310 n=2 Tax=Ziziphus jujuba TaxID=326968 RepID=A0A6P4ALA1_ZIZJJ|nr:uncharacterized protein LOC107424310 [Ziziphus jujuba]KAH7519806.1 hypothetical protein FEM48_Zijuj08G0076200 [Ziziphus jujuba var. spinosa]